MDINEVFINCVDKWTEKGFDDRVNQAIDNFEDWIQAFDEDERNILCELLEKFSYYSQNNIIEIIKELSQESINRFGISNDNSVISVVRKADGKLNSSHEYWQLHRIVSGLSKKIYYDSLDGIDNEDWENIQNIVFVDDCSGTGTQFVNFLKRQKKTLLKKHVILIAVELVENAKIYIDDYSKQTGIDINVISYSVKEKAFNNTSAIKKNKFVSMSQKKKIDKNYVLGFQDAEALMAFYNNSPYDTLGLFWFPFGENTPIFPRELDEEPGWKRSHKEKKERRRCQYEAKCH